ncbi:MAG: bifunctional phosphoribosylaminoimidazolecarboxamide formyltransferase/IMP cyclohydrolase [Gemmatimonadetes bacterium]|nr:bifunctional phosphoribosylaminoimidazolecarboxamide formyltransferase/IMP cyclohydrolase [Gemmatimonadota bacterium]MYA41196.1 bifunctional phosphoribosylaminoimidazolecarboxamide formyltransferase/IMP cyclohydrolase [Gemmatimonadota bacterium]MYE93636.1 bifunctional phosphoribosylaminoimidazolecarboxamide formyltransferase/IMP cyclohydrolase [Gemmatimonadota bacterium]MYJ10190.1 bifunctional phosphoribosylaminoimidazolecarboxamide formyltransferase/IMP cyclohydrolase [Gemmatimonadota bacter
MARRRALLSVSDKTGVVAFARALAEQGWEVLSTGGTARSLREAGLDVTDVSAVTGHPEMMDGRVKTLHPAIHAGLLARRSLAGDMAALWEQGYRTIDLVAVNLYPFRETIAASGVTLTDAMENVDIGGPTLIRAAAKNHGDVWVVVDPADYDAVLEAVAAVDRGDATASASALSAELTVLRRRLAAKVFRHISAYDEAIAGYLEGLESGRADTGRDEPMAGRVTLTLERREELRYGENPGQGAAFYAAATGDHGIAKLDQIHGKSLSYNNILDLDGALLSLAPFAFSPDPAVCIVKHTTPCGLAVSSTLADAFARARRTDPVSAFGSVIAVNRPLDRDTAKGISSMFVECVVAPRFTSGALAELVDKKNIRLLELPDARPAGSGGRSSAGGGGAEADEAAKSRFLARAAGHEGAISFRSVYGGVLFQSLPDPPLHGRGDPGWKVVTARHPTAAERADLSFAWAAVAGVKSNAILLAKNGATVGIGAGQTSRVDSSRLAVRKAREARLEAELDGCVLASDAFFPFRDGVDAAADAGARAIVQPGGSIRDDEVVAAADEHGIAMVFTGRRLFRH